MMAKIKHIAIRTPDPEKTAAFYKQVFGLEEVVRARAGYQIKHAVFPPERGAFG
jgi:catechol 2,3-dioxygenase-like lactoylglutathione lyase family enzyme